MDAANVDLKGFSEAFYRDVCAGHLAPVLDTLEYLVHETDVWVEITTLLIPGLNDSDARAGRAHALGRRRARARGAVSTSPPSIPTRSCATVPPTPPATLTRARAIALANGVRYAYTGNVHDPRANRRGATAAARS